MRPDQNRRNKMLAAEYVLGTLNGGARRRFEQWLRESQELREDVWYWERRLGRLHQSLPVTPTIPPARVWRNIQAGMKPAPPPVQKGILWPLFAIAATLAAVVMGALLFQLSNHAARADYIALMAKQGTNQPAWMITLDGDNRIRVKTLTVSKPAAKKDYQLWIVPASGRPIALPVLPPSGAVQVQLDVRQAELLRRGAMLAVSLEPMGGSPTGKPTGPVLFTGHIHAFAGQAGA